MPTTLFLGALTPLSSERFYPSHSEHHPQNSPILGLEKTSALLKPRPPKTESPDEFMINLSIQNYIPFPVPSLFSSGLRRIREKVRGTETKQDPLGPSQYKSPSMFHFFFVGKKALVA